MKSSSWPIVRKILWPERASLFVIIGGAIGLAGDITSFFSEFVSPAILTGAFAVIAAVAALLCLQRAFLVNTADDAAVQKVVECRTCDIMRFSLFAVAAFIVLLLVGQDKTATETIASKLGLIHEDVKKIGEDVGKISQDVSDISDVTQSQKLVAKPETAADYFRNAWIYTNIHRDPAKAHQSLNDMYDKTEVGKLDAAELYFDTGRQVEGRNPTVEKIIKTGKDKKDPALLVVAARNASDVAEGDALIAEAQSIDPSYPFAYWDPQRFVTLASATAPTPPEQMALMERLVGGTKKFIELIGSKPSSAYFFLPQYQPDYEALANQTLTSSQKTLQSYQDSQRRIEDAMKKRGN